MHLEFSICLHVNKCAHSAPEYSQVGPAAVKLDLNGMLLQPVGQTENGDTGEAQHSQKVWQLLALPASYEPSSPANPPDPILHKLQLRRQELTCLRPKMHNCEVTLPKQYNYLNLLAAPTRNEPSNPSTNRLTTAIPISKSQTATITALDTAHTLI